MVDVGQQEAMARQIEDALGAREGDKAPGKGKILLIAALAVIVLAGAGFAGLKILQKPPHHGPPVPGKIISLPQETLNLSDGYLLQVTVAMQATTTANTKLIATDQPQLLNAEIMILGGFSYPELLAPGGKAAAQAKLLASFQKILGPSSGQTQVLAILFTSFVMEAG